MPSPEYEGRPVRKHSVTVRGASGDALNGSLKVAPRDFHPGQLAYVLLEVNPTDVNHKVMDEGDAWERVQVTKTLRGRFVDEALALPLLDEIDVALEDLRVEETGQERLNLETKLADDHRAGLHKRAREACELCQAADPLGVHGDEDAAKADELAAKREAHGDGEGDPDNPLPGARKRRTRPKAK